MTASCRGFILRCHVVLYFVTSAHVSSYLFLFLLRSLRDLSQILGPTNIVAVVVIDRFIAIQRTRRAIAIGRSITETNGEPSDETFFQPRLSRFGAHLPMGVLPCCYGDFWARGLQPLCCACSALLRDAHASLGPTNKDAAGVKDRFRAIQRTRREIAIGRSITETNGEPYTHTNRS